MGMSDVLYFGKASNREGLHRRIRQYFHPGYGNATSLRIRKKIISSTNLELSWIECPADRTKEIEDRLLADFERAYGKLPLWNKRH